MIAPAHREDHGMAADLATSEVGQIAESEIPVTRERSREHVVARAIARHPAIALVSAAAIGMTLGWFVKRRMNQT